VAELLKVYHTIAVGVSLFDHPGQLLRRQGVPQPRHGVSQLRRRDEAVPVAVEHPEKLPQLLVRVGRFRRKQLRRHQRDELGELHQAVVVGVRSLDEHLQLVRTRLQT